MNLQQGRVVHSAEEETWRGGGGRMEKGTA